MDADRAEQIVIDDEPECEGATRVDRGDVRYTIGADRSPGSNAVAFARWRPAEVDPGVTEVVGVYRARGAGFSWSVGPLTDAPGLAAALGARGLRREPEALIVAAALPLRAPRIDRELRFVEELDLRTVTDALRLDRSLAGDDLRARIEARLRYLACPSHRGGGVVAYRRDLAVGYGRWRDGTDAESVFLAGAFTLQPHRRSGVYAAILAYRLDRAARRGRTVAVVAAERATIAPILRRRGFRDVAARTIWVGR